MTQLIIVLNDLRRAEHARQVEKHQHALGMLQREYSDSTLAFKALGLAYEATRLAWYAVKREHDGEHIGDVESMLDWVRSHLNGE